MRFIAVGDVGTADASERLVAQAVGEKCAESGCDFLLLLGDLVYPNGVHSVDDPDWGPAIEVPYESLGIPIRPVLGNHDYGSNGDDPDRAGYVVARSGVDSLWEMPSRVYAIEEEQASLLVLDSNALIFDFDGAMDTQSAFAADTLAAASGTAWRISAAHHPYLSNGDHGDAIGNVKTFYESSICGNVDLVLAAHDHSRQVLKGTDACPAPMVLSGAGAEHGTLPGDHPVEWQSDSLGFAYVVVTDDVLQVEMIGADGSLDYGLELHRTP